MGILERKQRLKEATRANILEAALGIVRSEGWLALSMRKIAEQIEYTTPVIYEYFPGKESLLLEFTRLGFLRLGQQLEHIMHNQPDPQELMGEMWLAYWNFAFKEKEYYQLMFGVDMACAGGTNLVPESRYPASLFKAAVKGLYPGDIPEEHEINAKYYTYWSAVHGLISINMVHQGTSELTNKHILVQSVMAINRSITG